MFGKKIFCFLPMVLANRKESDVFENRVYQGSSGVVYPYPVIEKFQILVKKKPIMLFIWRMSISRL